MEKITVQITSIIKTVSELGIGLIALGIIAEIVFGQGAIFGASVVSNLSAIVGSDWRRKWFRWAHRTTVNRRIYSCIVIIIH